MRNFLFAMLVAAAPTVGMAQTPATLAALRGADAVSVNSAPVAAPVFGGGSAADVASLVGAGVADRNARAPGVLASAGAFSAADLARLEGVGAPVVRVQDARVAFLQHRVGGPRAN